jgi:hypothetical protein
LNLVQFLHFPQNIPGSDTYEFVFKGTEGEGKGLEAMFHWFVGSLNLVLVLRNPLSLLTDNCTPFASTHPSLEERDSTLGLKL